jgi:FKBP-type peptidyl-prolyl cis-trans isomerase FklB
VKLSSIAILSVSLLCANVYASDNSTQSSTTSGAEMQTAGSKNQLTGEAFLAENKKKPGVVTLPDGLQYKVMTEGKGPKPTATDTVTVNYAGSLINGTEFDSSYKRGEPLSFPVGGVIPGWVEALQLMHTGSTWMLYIPANLAYGENGAPPAIGPNETLIFKVELLAVKK